MFYFGYHIFLSGLLAVAIRPILPERSHTIVSLKITQALDGRVSLGAGVKAAAFLLCPSKTCAGDMRASWLLATAAAFRSVLAFPLPKG